MFTILLIIALILLAIYSLDSANTKEKAIQYCKKTCQQRDVQLLDETVQLINRKFRWTNQGIRIERHYSFDFTEEGTIRHSGSLILLAHTVKEFSLGLPQY